MRPQVLCSLALSIALTPCASAVTIYSRTSADSVSVNTNPASAISWTQTGTYTNVTVTAFVANFTGPNTGTFYLTDLIGPSATELDNEIAEVPYSEGVGTVIVVFTGLTLGPGTYYLVLSDLSANSGWAVATNTTTTTDTGVTANSDQAASTAAAYPPSSTFFVSASQNRLFSITGDPVTQEIPEPSTVWLSGAGLIAAGLAAGRRRLRLR